ncbi:MAG: peptidoglycan-binding protein [Candidatus Omnitrophica bacterium]|nr:peptidoglycan-binding protein [Candidatus Omnitrophota bacterium]
MKHGKWGIGALLVLAVVAAGCSKKSSDQANLSVMGTGLETFSTSSEELAQLPQATGVSQQAGIEVLPIEVAPVTPGANLSASTALITQTASETAAMVSSAQNLSYHQKIQTALKNAGFYSGNIDGKIGPASKRAIEEFQRANNLTVDGKVGPKTWSVLERYLSGSMETTQASQ